MATDPSLTSKMKPYYIGVALLSVALIAVATAVLITGAPRRHDRVVAQNFQQVMEDVTGYIDSKNVAPESLNDVYVRNIPEGIEYRKLTDKIYMICATYQRRVQADNYDSTNTQPSVTYQTELQKLKDADTTTHFVASERYGYFSDGHEAGRNCYVLERQYDGNSSPWRSNDFIRSVEQGEQIP